MEEGKPGAALNGLDIKVSEDGQSVALALRTDAIRATIPLSPTALAGLIDVLQKAAAMADERRRLAATRLARQ